MSDITLRQLEYFIAIIDAGSVTAASRQVNVTQATVSMAIAQLEKRLGIDLLIRHKAKGVVATRAGREFSARARRILEMATDLERSTATRSSEMSGALKVGCVSSLSPQVVPPLAAHFEREYPQVTFNYREGSAGDLQAALMDGVLDLVVIFSRQTIDAVESRELAEVVLKIMLPSSHPLSNRSEISFMEVAHESAILIDLPPSRDRSIEFMRAAGVEPRIRWTSANLATVTALVANGLGYSLRYSLPGETCAPGSGVVEVTVSDAIPTNAISTAMPRGMQPPRRVDEAVRLLKKVLSDEGICEVSPGTA